MKTFDQILGELLSNLRTSPASGFVSPAPATAAASSGKFVALPPASSLPEPRTPAWPGSRSTLAGSRRAPARKPVAQEPVAKKSAVETAAPTSSLPKIDPSQPTPEPARPSIESEGPIRPVPPVSSPDYAALYQAPRCNWGRQGNAYVPRAPWRSSAPTVSTPPRPSAAPVSGPTSRGPGTEGGTLPRRTRLMTASERRDPTDCRSLLDRPADDEFGTRVFRLFD